MLSSFVTIVSKRSETGMIANKPLQSVARIGREDLIEGLWPESHLPHWMSCLYRSGWVSVLIPTHNRARFIGSAVESVRNQTYRPIELIVVDDGSTDDTWQVIADFARAAEDKTFTVRYIKQPKLGAPAARNRGLVESSGEFIQFLNSDDVLHPRKIECHIAALAILPAADYAWSDHNFFDAEAGAPTFDNIDTRLVRESRFVENPPWFSTAASAWDGFYRRSVCAKIGPWNERLKRWQDLEYQLRFTALGPSCRHVPAIFVSMGEHAGERIHDYFQKPEGVEAGMSSLECMEQTLDTFGEPSDTFARNVLATFT